VRAAGRPARGLRAQGGGEVNAHAEPSRSREARWRWVLRRLRPAQDEVHQGVRRRLMAVVVKTTAFALVLAALAMAVQDFTAYRGARVSQLTTEAAILGLAVAPALAFDDRAAAERSLAALRAHPAVLAAALYGTDGRQFARYLSSAQVSVPERLQAGPAVTLRGQGAVLSQRIVQNGEWLGTIYLRARFDMERRLLTYVGIVAFVSVAALIAALVLSRSLQRSITMPLDAMAGVARQVVERRDYSLRATRNSDDEIGVVVEAFNRMLDEVQARTRAIEQSNCALQQEVQVRQSAQSALARANAQLESTMVALREADRRKDEFLATLAHELRNPLAPIRNAAELLELHGADDAQRQWAREVIARQVKRMGLLLDDLLDVSRITRGRLELRKDRVTLAPLIATAIETARPLIDLKQHLLQVDLPDQNIELTADPLRLSQAISNLLNNAAKYTDARGHITLRARLEGDRLAITVEDNGIGFDPAMSARLFEMFAQLQAPVDRTEGGLGIGLALVRGLISLHGGTVEAVSAGPGRGSAFTIRLPGAGAVVCSDEDQGADRPRRHGAGRCRLLVADDNQDSAESLAMVMRMWGYEVHLAHTGTRALELALQERPEACILDIGMPGLNGYEVASRIRSEPWARQVLLLAVTGWGQSEDVTRAREAGFDHHMTKPVDLARVDALLLEHARRLQAGTIGIR
jgi:signal transduction histidine kinase/ActR/RegA family two-component response regulator